MKRSGILCFLLSVLTYAGVFAQNLKPYTVGAILSGDLSEVSAKVEESLKQNGFDILGSYRPVDDPARWLIVVTSGDITNAIKKVGGLTGFAAAWRVALTKENGKVIISYTTPEYWGNAYFRSDFPRVKSHYDAYAVKMKKAMAACGDGGGSDFGSEDGLSVDKLRTYKYKFGMPTFEKTKSLNTFGSFDEAVSVIDGNLSRGVENLELVYSYKVPGQNLKLYGIGLSGEDGEAHFMGKIDISEPRHTAFLPYEMLVMDNEVHMLHGRYRIALSFPDLSMGQFMKIVTTPPAIKRLMASATKR